MNLEKTIELLDKATEIFYMMDRHSHVFAVTRLDPPLDGQGTDVRLIIYPKELINRIGEETVEELCGIKITDCDKFMETANLDEYMYRFTCALFGKMNVKTNVADIGKCGMDVDSYVATVNFPELNYQIAVAAHDAGLN